MVKRKKKKTKDDERETVLVDLSCRRIARKVALQQEKTKCSCLFCSF